MAALAARLSLRAHCSSSGQHRRSFLAAASALALLSGCAAPTVRESAPGFELKGELGGKPFHLLSQKDIDASLICIATGSNGLSVTISNLNAKMNPAVITTTADGQTKMIQAQGEANAASFKAGLEGAKDLIGLIKP